MNLFTLPSYFSLLTCLLVFLCTVFSFHWPVLCLHFFSVIYILNVLFTLHCPCRSLQWFSPCYHYHCLNLPLHTVFMFKLSLYYLFLFSSSFHLINMSEVLIFSLISFEFHIGVLKDDISCLLLTPPKFAESAQSRQSQAEERRILMQWKIS